MTAEMSEKQDKLDAKDGSTVHVTSSADELAGIRDADDALLAQLGYKSEFRREFSVSTILNCQSRCCISSCWLALRNGRLRFLYHGCSSVRVVYVFFPARIG